MNTRMHFLYNLFLSITCACALLTCRDLCTMLKITLLDISLNLFTKIHNCDALFLTDQAKSIHEWEHVCFAWSSHRKNGYIAVDGCIASQASSITIKPGSDRQDTVIKGGGTIILGQDQDVYEGGFEADEGFIGELFDVQIWNEMVHPMNMKKIYNCSTKTGNIMSWFNQPMELRDVQVQHSEVCHLAMTQAKLYCFNYNLQKPIDGSIK